MSKKGFIITSGDNTEIMAKEIIALSKVNSNVNLDFKDVKLMTTTAAKEILKPIADFLGIDGIFKKIHFCNVAEDLKVVISTAIDSL